MSRNLLSLWLGLPVLALVVASGCGSKRLKTVPVSGEVHVNNKPAEGVFVSLIPKGGLPDGAPRPFGRTDADGKFVLSTYAEKDGAPPGEYVAIFEWPNTSGGLFNASADDGKDRLNGAYHDKDKSTQTVKIGKEPTVLQRFELTAPK